MTLVTRSALHSARSDEPMMKREHDSILEEQERYYRERAGEYDKWFLREGRHDLGP